MTTRYAQHNYTEEIEEVPVDSRAQPAPATTADSEGAANSRYYGAKEWNEPVFL